MEVTILGEYSLSPDTAIKSTFPLSETSIYDCLVPNSFNTFHALATSCACVFYLPPNEWLYVK